ncbi:hypothetical protein J6590_049062 [Homalodisca vitripennis]|nr:hypothetical protein J6590_049062 [Homalodisca vitripennis]
MALGIPVANQDGLIIRCLRFVSLMLPILKKQGVKILIGDNLSSHISLEKKEDKMRHNQNETKRRKRLNAPAGRSIGASDVLSPTQNKTEENVTLYTENPTKRKAQKQKKRKTHQSEDESDVSDTFTLQDSDELDLDLFREQLSDLDDDYCLQGTSKDANEEYLATGEFDEQNFSVEDYVVVNFDGTLFPGKVTEKKDGGYIVSVMEQSKKNWKWLSKPDAIFYDKESVVCHTTPKTD